MVRCLGVLLVLALLLCGCTQNTAEPTAPTENVNQSATATGLYIPGSELEVATNGAVRAFELNCYDFALLGEDLIALQNNNGEGKLALFQGENLEEIKTVSLGQNVLPMVSQMQVGQKGIGYIDTASNAVVFLSVDLAETGRAYLPEGITGTVCLSPDWQSVYYCTERGIHCLNLQTGIAHLLLEKNAFRQQLTGIFGNGQALRYELEVLEGQKQTLLIDAATGATLWESFALDRLVTEDLQYFMPSLDRGVRYLRFGSRDTHSVLWPAETNGAPHVLFRNNAVVMAQQQEQNTEFSYYDLATGKRTAAITLPSVIPVTKALGDGKNGMWFLSGEGRMYHWNSTKNASAEETVFTAPWYTKEMPDEAGLEQIKERALALGAKYNIDILVWEDAAALAPADQFLTGEHSTQLYELYLNQQEAAVLECLKNGGK